MQGASKDIPHAVCSFTHSSQKTIKVMTIMTLNWVDPVGRSELGIQEPQHTYSFPLGLTQILGSHLLADVGSIQAQIHSLLFFRTLGGVQALM